MIWQTSPIQGSIPFDWLGLSFLRGVVVTSYHESAERTGVESLKTFKDK